MVFFIPQVYSIFRSTHIAFTIRGTLVDSCLHCLFGYSIYFSLHINWLSNLSARNYLASSSIRLLSCSFQKHLDVIFTSVSALWGDWDAMLIKFDRSLRNEEIPLEFYQKGLVEYSFYSKKPSSTLVFEPQTIFLQRSDRANEAESL
jgi:hypothetical protein